jgi:hypothetical protein
MAFSFLNGLGVRRRPFGRAALDVAVHVGDCRLRLGGEVRGAGMTHSRFRYGLPESTVGGWLLQL